MPSRTVFAPEVITRQPTQPAEWPLRFELVEKRFYRVRAPLGAQVELKDYQKLILQDSLKGTPPEETAATYSKMAGEELTPASLKSPLRAVIRRTRSRTVFEAACKAVVLGSVNLNLEVDVNMLQSLDEAQLAVLAAKGAGHTYKSMNFLSPYPATLTRYSQEARAIFGLPEYAPTISVVGTAFACGSFIVGEPYVLAPVALGVPTAPQPDV